jgi:hypothetical protein
LDSIYFLVFSKNHRGKYAIMDDVHFGFLQKHKHRIGQGTTSTGLLSNVSVFSYIFNIFLISSYIKPSHVVVVIFSLDQNKFPRNVGDYIWNIDLRWKPN